MSALKNLIEKKKDEAFRSEYRSKATDEEALGLIISSYFQWNGLAILRTLYSALEDANFHRENKAIQALINRLEKLGEEK